MSSNWSTFFVLCHLIGQHSFQEPDPNKCNCFINCFVDIDLTRFAIQAKGPDGKWTRKPLAYRESNNVHLLITRPPEICVYLVFKHIHAVFKHIQSVDNLFHSFIVLCENECFLMSNLH